MPDVVSVKTVTEDLNKYNFCAKEGDYISITEWINGEGWDIDLNGQSIRLHESELDAINYLTKVLEYENKR